jgi:hypothetical protein
MRRFAASAAGLALLAGVLGAAPSSAITGGNLDGTTHPYVGALFYPGTGLPICSGVLVPSARRGVVFLTVAHCLAGITNKRSVMVSFKPVAGPAGRLAGTYVPDPAYNPKAADPHDLAVVVFAHKPAIRPAALAPLGAAATRLPRPFTTVGYGIAPGGVRKKAIEIGTRVGGAWLYLRPGTGNSCYADSGGPDLLGTPSRPLVAALTDEGPCFGRGSFDKDFRVDTVEAHWFVNHA